MVIKCDSGRILYASETASTAIGYQPKDLVDKLIFEIIHPTDIKQVKDQLYVYDINNCKFSNLIRF
jgi:PAS domain S-box-containing protein